MVRKRKGRPSNRPFRGSPGEWPEKGSGEKSRKKLARKMLVDAETGMPQHMRRYYLEKSEELISKAVEGAKSENWSERYSSVNNLLQIMDLPEVFRVSAEKQHEINKIAVKELIRLTKDKQERVREHAIRTLRKLVKGESKQAEWLQQQSGIKNVVLRRLAKLRKEGKSKSGAGNA